MNRTGIGLKIVFTLVLAGLVMGGSSPSLATGPAFTGFAAKADTAETVYLNPAGMARLERPSFYGNPLILYTENSTEITAEGVEGKRTLDDDSVMFLPGLYYCRPLNDRWSIGIGPNGASGIGTSYGDEWAGRYILDEWSMFFVGIAPSVAYRVNDELSLGGSVSANYSQFNLKKAVFNPDAPNAPGEFELETDGFAFGGTVGLLYEFTPQTRFGIVYRSELEASNEGDPEFSDLTPARQALLDRVGILDQEVSIDTNQPQSVVAGIFHDFGNGWTMTLDSLWVDFSEWNIDNIEIGNIEITKEGTEYQDIWAASLGFTYDWKPDWTLGSGVGYVSSVVEDENRTLFTRYDEIWAVGVGIKHQFNERRSLGLDVTFIQFGDGEFEISDAPIVGDIKGEYDKNYGVSFGISTTW
ncbi:MAG: hypothetical protein GQ528_08045 [Woeseiaceae bacterium]|nr:hypothetical protein [Woeseiaceae bacterium]